MWEHLLDGNQAAFKRNLSNHCVLAHTNAHIKHAGAKLERNPEQTAQKREVTHPLRPPFHFLSVDSKSLISVKHQSHQQHRVGPVRYLRRGLLARYR